MSGHKMSVLLLLTFLVNSTCFAQDVPYYNRASDTQQDIGAINQNFRDLSGRKDLLSEGDVPSQYQQCIFNPQFCVDNYNQNIIINSSVTINGSLSFVVTSTTTFGWVDIGITEASVTSPTNTAIVLCIPSNQRVMTWWAICNAGAATGIQNVVPTANRNGMSILINGCTNVTATVQCARVK